jgi:hypothetical protein
MCSNFQVPKAKGQSPRDSLKIFFFFKTPYDIIFDKHTLIVLIWKTESYFYCLNLDNSLLWFATLDVSIYNQSSFFFLLISTF